MKMTKKEMPISKALTEVWEWKEEVYKDINKMSFEEKKRYLEKGLNKAVRTIKGKLKTNPDGSYSIVQRAAHADNCCLPPFFPTTKKQQKILAILTAISDNYNSKIKLFKDLDLKDERKYTNSR